MRERGLKSSGLLVALLLGIGEWGTLGDAAPLLVPQVGHSAPVGAVAYSPDGKHILTGSDDNTARVWDAATGQEILSLKGHSNWVDAVAYSPDGKQILTGSLKERKELGHGLLTYALLAGLHAVDKGPLRDDEGVKPYSSAGIATVNDWLNYARGKVPSLMQQYYGREHDIQAATYGDPFPILPVRD